MSKKNIQVLLLICAVLILWQVAVWGLLHTQSNSWEVNNEYSSNIDNEVVEDLYADIKVHTIEKKDDHNTMLLHLSYPVTENHKINTRVKELSDGFVEEYEQTVKERGQLGVVKDFIAGVDFLQYFEVSFINEHYVFFTFHQQASLGNNWSNDIIVLNFNRQTGEELHIKDLFKNENYLNFLSDYTKKYLKDEAAKKIQEDQTGEVDSNGVRDWLRSMNELIDKGTAPLEKNFDGVALSREEGLVITFDKYQVGPGAYGEVVVKIPSEYLQDELAEPFLSFITKSSVPAFSTKPDISDKDKEEGAINYEAVDCLQEKCVALTFDDGPSVYTDKLLDILKTNQIPATFFVLGRSAVIQSNTLQRMTREGHQIANHTWNHKDLRKLNAEQIHKEIQSTTEVIDQKTNQKFTMMLRPPYGALTDIVKQNANMPIILWNIDSLDWKFREVHLVVTRMTEAKPGAIILGHDIHETTVDAIPEVVKTLKARGYRFVTVENLLSTVQPKAGKVYSSQGGAKK